MTELKAFESILDIAVNLTILLGTGAAVTWWMTRRIENRIEREVKHMDRLQSIEKRMDNMATKDDVADMAAKMATQMVTKEDIAARMDALKTDLLEAIKNANGNGHR